MNQAHAPAAHRDQATQYEVRLQGCPADRWAAWFDGLTITYQTDGTTVLGPVIDQTTLHALLQRIRDLGLPLVGVGAARMPRPSIASPQPRVDPIVRHPTPLPW